MKKVRITGVLKSVEKVNHFEKSLLRLKIDFRSGKIRELSVIVYAPIEMEEGLTEYIGKFITMDPIIINKKQPVSVEKYKTFTVFFANKFKPISYSSYDNDILLDCTLESEVEIKTDKQGVDHANFTIKTNTFDGNVKSLSVTCKGELADEMLTVSTGQKFTIEGFFKTARRVMQIQGEPFEFDTFIVTANKLLI